MSYISDHALYGVGAFSVSTDPAVKVFKPANTEQRNAFTNLQSQLNHAARLLGFPQITVDGVIGSGTYASALKVSGWTKESSPATIGNLASYAAEYAEVYSRIAQNLEVDVEEKKDAEAVAKMPPKVTVLPSIGMKGYLPYLLAAGSILGILYLLSKKSSKKKKTAGQMIAA